MDLRNNKNDIKFTRTEQMWFSPTNKLSHFCHLSKNLYNEANYIIKQEFDLNNKWIRYNKLDKILNGSEIFLSNNYKKLPSGSAQQILKLLDKSWKAFFISIKDWKKNPNKYEGRPKPPNYKKKDGEHILIFTNQQCKIKDGILHFPKKVNLEIKTRLPSTTDLREVRIIPKGMGYVCEIVYNKEVKPEKTNKSRVIGIDFGVSNIVTMVNNIGLKPIIIRDDGNGIKSTNQYYNKKKVDLQSIYDHQGIKNGAKMDILTTKRNKKVHDYNHKLSRYIINYCVTNNIGTIIFGYNEGWKQSVNIGKRNNQNFTQIPYMGIIEKTTYKAEEVGIDVIKQEESYTSKCSFLDNEPISHHNQYAGKRFKRGLFRSNKGIVINSDVNAGYNIVKKAIPKAIPLRIRRWIGGCGLHPLRVNLLRNEFNIKSCNGVII